MLLMLHYFTKVNVCNIELCFEIQARDSKMLNHFYCCFCYLQLRVDTIRKPLCNNSITCSFVFV